MNAISVPLLSAYGLWHVLQPAHFHAWLSPFNLSPFVSIAKSSSAPFGTILDLSSRIFGDHKDINWLVRQMSSINEGRFVEFVLFAIINKAFYQAQKQGSRWWFPENAAEIGYAIKLEAQGNCTRHTPAWLWFLAIALASGHVKTTDIYQIKISRTETLYLPPDACVQVLREVANHMGGEIDCAHELIEIMPLTNSPLDFAAKVLLREAGAIPADMFDQQLITNINGFVNLYRTLDFGSRYAYSLYTKYIILAESVRRGTDDKHEVFLNIMNNVFGDRAKSALIILPLVSIQKYAAPTKSQHYMQIAAKLLQLPAEFSEVANDSSVNDHSEDKQKLRWVNAIMQHKDRFQEAWQAISSPTMLPVILQLASSAEFTNSSQDIKLLETCLKTFDALLESHEQIVPFPTLAHVYTLGVLDDKINAAEHDNIKDIIARSPVYARVKQQTESINNILRALRSIDSLAQLVSQNTETNDLSTQLHMLESMLDSELLDSNYSAPSFGSRRLARRDQRNLYDVTE